MWVPAPLLLGERCRYANFSAVSFTGTPQGCPYSVLPFLVFDVQSTHCFVASQCADREEYEHGEIYALQDQCTAIGLLVPNFYDQLYRDFSVFGQLTEFQLEMTKDMCRQNKEQCFVLRIQGGVPYLQWELPPFESRHTQHFQLLLRVMAKYRIPDCEIVVDTSDGGWPESECPSENGSHTWSLAYTAPAGPFEDKDPRLFFRGRPTSAHRTAALRTIMANCPEEDRDMKIVDHGAHAECVPIAEWCRYQFLANIPGNTMTLSLKYRLLCNSVTVSTPFFFHEWYYHLLEPNVHYAEVPSWERIRDGMKPGQGKIARAARRLAKAALSEEAVDCYWRRLLEHAAVMFPLSSEPNGTPLQLIVAQPRRHTPPFAVEVILTIPARGSDRGLMHLLRTTWLNQSRKGKWMHYFVFCDKDPDKFEMDDVIIVECEHGYDHLLSKMIAAYKELLKRYPGVSIFSAPTLITRSRSTSSWNASNSVPHGVFPGASLYMVRMEQHRRRAGSLHPLPRVRKYSAWRTHAHAVFSTFRSDRQSGSWQD
eukprot:GEMP01030491.1.p1 GENE.GEMP01030491.1~~GEMP01030491.1.p1  ORF type:complete len:538 (+),score=83.33 GEMP01030491.1:2-1615(+)